MISLNHMVISPLVSILVYSTCLIPNPSTQSGSRDLPDCEWCGALEAPSNLSWQTTIADSTEPGERLILSGTIYHADNQTHAANILIYAYHTNAKGIYPKRGDETGNARRHGYLRAWVKTDAKGRYQFNTIKPASYPSSTEAAHIHMTIKEPGKDEYWIDSVRFADDPLLRRERNRTSDRGGSGIVELRKNDDGVWLATRDIFLARQFNHS